MTNDTAPFPSEEEDFEFLICDECQEEFNSLKSYEDSEGRYYDLCDKCLRLYESGEDADDEA